MSKQESTAINQLIDLAHRRGVDGEDARDELFVTAPARHPLPGVRAYPGVVPAGAPIAPLPRRRVPNATPPIEPIDYPDDAETQIDPRARGARPAAPPADHYDPTERVERYAPLPPAAWPVALPRQAQPAPRQAPQARPAPVRSTYVLPTQVTPCAPGFEHLETVRVAALPPPDVRQPARPDQLPTPPTLGVLDIIQKCAAPFGALALMMMFVGGFIVHSGQGGHARAAAVDQPIVMAVSPAPAPAPAPAPPPTPVVIAPAEPAVPAVASAAPVEPVAAPVAEPEIEMDATPVARVHPHHQATTGARSQRPVVSERTVKASAPRRADPVATAFAEPTPSGKPAAPAALATGPGRVTVTSTPSALIYVDGRSTNLMTPKSLALAPGSHKITLLELTSRKAKTSDVVVASGATSRIAKTF